MQLADFLPSGDEEASPISVDYYRNKAREFQATMNAAAQVEESLRATLESVVFDDDGLAAEIQLALSDFENRRAEWQLTTEGINAASSAMNALGIRFPSISAPAGFGFAQIPIAVIVAVAAAATLITWGLGWMYNAKDLQLRALAVIQDPKERDKVAAQVATTENALSAATNPLSSVANLLKWGAILVGGYMVYKLMKDK